jgi:hypothetical protein
MTPAECNRLAASYDFFGLFDGNRCIGFKDLKQAAVAAATGNDACSLACSGGGGAKCGGKASMQLFARNKPLLQLAPVSGERANSDALLSLVLLANGGAGDKSGSCQCSLPAWGGGAPAIWCTQCMQYHSVSTSYLHNVLWDIVLCIRPYKYLVIPPAWLLVGNITGSQ